MSAGAAGDQMPTALPAACRLCGAALAGPYCHSCGQASVAAQRSFREVLMGQSGRLLHTLRLLLTRPGELAREIDEGRDRLSLRPLTLLLNLIPLFFLLGGGPGGFNARTLMSGDDTGTMVATLAHLAQEQGIAPALLEERMGKTILAMAAGAAVSLALTTTALYVAVRTA